MVAVATVVDMAVNPGNTAQYYVLWGNGRIDAYGGAVPITGQATFYYTFEQPIVVAIHITNWATGAGYMLDVLGAFQPLNGATPITSASGDTFVNSNGLPYVQTRRYVAWSWNPDGSGQGYAVDYWGELYEFGGAVDPARLGAKFTNPSVKAFQMQWTPSKKGYILDLYGKVWPEWAAGTPSPESPYYPNDVARDLEVTDWATNSGYVLTSDGATHPFGAAVSSGISGPYSPGVDVARTFKVLSATNPTKFRQVQAGGQTYDYVASDPPTVTAGGGSNEVQRVTITGTPTGGTFTLTYSGQTTAAIARNAVASAVQTALENLSNIAVGDVVVTGGPGPGTPWTVTFTGVLGQQDVAQMTATSSLTGGSTPAVAVTTQTTGIAGSPATTVTTTTRPTLAWSYSDPQNDSQAAWELYGFTQAYVTANSVTDPTAHVASALFYLSGINPSTRGVETPIDLTNAAYRFFVRAKDTAGQWSAWSSRGWTQGITPPTAPTTMTATADNVNLRVNLSAVTGGTAQLVRFEYTDDGGTTVLPVPGADALPRIATTLGVDQANPLGLPRQYRAVAYSTNPRVASAPSAWVSATVTTRTYALNVYGNTSLGGEVGVQAPAEWVRPSSTGVFQGLGAEFAVVLSDGVPKSRRITLHLVCETKAEWLKVEAIVEATGTLIYRDPFGDVMYCRVAGDWSRAQRPAAPLLSESTPLRHFHVTDLPMVEVAPPVTAS